MLPVPVDLFETHPKFILHNQYSRQRTLLLWFYKIYLEQWLADRPQQYWMVINATKLYGLIQIWITLTFIQGRKVTESYNLCNPSILKWHDEEKKNVVIM